MGFPGGTVVKIPPASAGDAGHMGSIPGSGRSPGVGNGNPLQYSCLENFMVRGAHKQEQRQGHVNTAKGCQESSSLALVDGKDFAYRTIFLNSNRL